jgi:hypothetical protein
VRRRERILGSASRCPGGFIAERGNDLLSGHRTRLTPASPVAPCSVRASEPIRSRTSHARHAVVRGPSLTGRGKRPERTPSHQLDALMGISARTCGRRKRLRGSISCLLYCLLPLAGASETSSSHRGNPVPWCQALLGRSERCPSDYNACSRKDEPKLAV